MKFFKKSEGPFTLIQSFFILSEYVTGYRKELSSLTLNSIFRMDQDLTYRPESGPQPSLSNGPVSQAGQTSTWLGLNAFGVNWTSIVSICERMWPTKPWQAFTLLRVSQSSSRPTSKLPSPGAWRFRCRHSLFSLWSGLGLRC